MRPLKIRPLRECGENAAVEGPEGYDMAQGLEEQANITCLSLSISANAGADLAKKRTDRKSAGQHAATS